MEWVRWLIMMNVRLFAVLLIGCVHSEAALLDESFNSGFPSGFSIMAGSAGVSGGMLQMYSACVQLPGTFDRSQDLVIEVRARIGNGPVGDFNIHGLYDSVPVCAAVPTNGYFTGWYPAGSDNPLDLISLGTAGVGVWISSTPSRISAGQWYTFRQEFYADGTINTYIDGVRTMSVVNASRSNGFIGLRSWENVDVDWVRVTAGVPEPGSMILTALGGGLLLSVRRRLLR